ncbi:AGE family epimerase/isomerase [Sediminitomix flava]|uniref:Mannose/cellobiose epimerase-like protein (N-acyl-D-glucosamine 2-epimerase family) n=1 Tax=Sediminitomix flava TaxID=379075 RepID=A0A315ZET3_SEDFL|nr:AGE family epimerase/isomerase [Sediminitomix flava]PWJ43673.1 mannose/cellobiose epimerase-like protein (N-acyl-D-glucosamine 2-epimerase family) [Sediminitomix flava]
MIRQTLLSVFFLTVFSCAPQKEVSTPKLPDVYKQNIENLIGFFDKNAWNDSLGVYYSELDNEGNLQSEKVYTVALSRLIYGLSYTSEFYPENLDKAERLIKFQLESLIASDTIGLYSISSIENGVKDSTQVLDIWQQAYGLCGLSEFYRQKPNKALLEKIHALHDGFVSRFHDVTNGGFWSNYEIGKGGQSGSKSLQSLMYPITAYTANLWLADKENRKKYEPFIQENIALLYKNAWNEDTNWVNVKFNDDWSVCNSEDPNKPCFTVTPGHNFQLASLFLRTDRFTFFTDKEIEKYQRRGIEILEATLNKRSIYHEGKIKNGFYSEVNPFTNEILDERKTWWQHAEAILALSLVKDDRYEKELKLLKNFFFSHFPDHKYGGEYFFITKDNEPVRTEWKGSIGKSTYHTTEMIRFLMEKESE